MWGDDKLRFEHVGLEVFGKHSSDNSNWTLRIGFHKRVGTNMGSRFHIIQLLQLSDLMKSSKDDK